MLAKTFGISVLAVIASTSIAHSTCLKETDIKRQKPDMASHVEEIGRNDGAIVSLYRQKGGKQFVEVIRKNRCITSVEVLGDQALSFKYGLYPDSWDERGIAQEEALDNEGMSENDEAEVASDPDIMLPFLAMDRFRVSRVYAGPIARPDFKGRDRAFANFRTRISNGMRNGVNFSGQYAVTQIGCGTGCSFAFVSDLKTGQQFDFPRGGEEAGPMSLKHEAGSRLLIATWREGAQCVLESMVFDGKQWASLAKSPIGDVDACYDDIDENIEAYRRKVLGEPNPADVGERAVHPTAGTPMETYAVSSEQMSTPEPGLPEGLTEYDNINVAALLDLYDGYEGVRACFKARENKSTAYLTRSDMAKADAAFKQDEAEILKRDPRIDKEAVARKAYEMNKLFTSVILINGKFEMNYEHFEACRRLAALFPPGIENAKLRKREVIGQENSGGGLIVPQYPRFR